MIHNITKFKTKSVLTPYALALGRASFCLPFPDVCMHLTNDACPHPANEQTHLSCTREFIAQPRCGRGGWGRQCDGCSFPAGLARPFPGVQGVLLPIGLGWGLSNLLLAVGGCGVWERLKGGIGSGSVFLWRSFGSALRFLFASSPLLFFWGPSSCRPSFRGSQGL